MSQLHNQDKFSFFVPAEIKKGKNKKGKEEMRIKGIASSEAAVDTDGETLMPTGFDIQPLLTTGFLNWDHQQKGKPTLIVGEPDVAEIVNGGRDLYIEGFLYPTSEEARGIYKLAKTLEQDSPDRRLGFSIEGQVVERGCGPEFLDEKKTLRNAAFSQELWNKVVKARITGCAITPQPKNPNTLMQIVKSQTAHMLMESVYDDAIQDEIKKAFTVEENQETVPEDVEGTKNPNKIPLGKPGSEGLCPVCHKPKTQCVCVKKAMGTGNTPGFETVEKGSVGKVITKSEVYDLIADNYTTDVEKAKQIYSFIQEVNKKLFNNMEKITSEVIQKAFDFLNSTSLVKSEETAPIEKSEVEKAEDAKKLEEEVEKSKNAEDSDENLEKAKKMCKGFMDSDADITKGAMIDELKKAGFSTATAEGASHACITEASANKNGGAGGPGGNVSDQIEEVHPTVINKGLEDSINGSFSAQTEILKSLHTGMNQKFSALGQILKSASEQNELLKGQIDTLTESNKRLNERLGVVEKAKQPAKSVRTVEATPRFEKSEENNIGTGTYPAGTQFYSLSKSDEAAALGEIMFAQAIVAREKNQPNALLEKAIGDLEITRSLPTAIVHQLKVQGIVVTK